MTVSPAVQKLKKKRFANLDALSLGALCQSEARMPPRSVLVVFHGYGATAEDLLPLAPSFAQSMQEGMQEDMQEGTQETTQVFLQAPTPCLIEGCATGRAWFPLQFLSYEEIVSGLRSVEGCVAEALDEIGAHYGVPSHRIALFGFSQGGMVALQAACNAEHAWLATVGVATRFVEPRDLRTCASQKSTPLLMIHGEEDEIVPFQQGWETASMLREKGYNLAWIARAGMGHAIDQTALQSACDFLGRHARQIPKEQTQTEIPQAKMTQAENVL